MAGLPTGRSALKTDQFDAVIGKKKLKCKLTVVFKGKNVDTNKSKGKCSGVKKTEKVKDVAVKSKSSGAEYSMSMTITARSGNVKFTKVTVTVAAEGSGGSGEGSGGQGGSGGSGSPGKGSGGKGGQGGSGGSGIPGTGSGGPGGPGMGSGGPGGPGMGSGGPGGPGSGSGGPEGPGGPNGEMEECACVEVFGFPNNGPGGPGQGSGGSGQGSGEPGEGSGSPGNTAAPGSEDMYVTQAKALIDAGSCNRVTSNSVCGTAATGYYKEFEYNGMMVVVSSGAPDHPAEHDQFVTNPNTRCERWQFMQVPLNPGKGGGVPTGMGTVGLAVTGGGFFNHLSRPDGSLALANEGRTLDSCLGHSAGGGTYHYHANINCTDAGAATGANNPNTCLKIGYYRDGVPVYGFCKDSNDEVMTSCYSLVSGSTTSTLVTVSGTYNVASTSSG